MIEVEREPMRQVEILRFEEVKGEFTVKSQFDLLVCYHKIVAVKLKTESYARKML